VILHIAFRELEEIVKIDLLLTAFAALVVSHGPPYGQESSLRPVRVVLL